MIRADADGQSRKYSQKSIQYQTTKAGDEEQVLLNDNEVFYQENVSKQDELWFTVLLN